MDVSTLWPPNKGKRVCNISSTANIVNTNTRITPILFDGNNYEDQAYSAKMAIGGPKRLGHINGSIKKPSKIDPKILRLGI